MKQKQSIALGSPAGPSLGDTISFLVEGVDNDEFWVKNEARQGGVLVYAQYRRVEAGAAGPFTLGPTRMWTEGAADGRAELIHWTRGRFKRVRNGVDVEYAIGE